MVKINPSDAMTELYGVDKGEAQVFKTDIAQDVLKQNKAIAATKQAAAQKAQEDRDADLQTQLAKMGNVKIMPRDQELIAGKGQGVRDYVVKNIDKLRKGDATAMMGFQQLYGDYKTTADMSQNTREDWEKTGAELMKDPEAYTPESIEAYYNHASKDSAGNFALDKSQFVKNINYGEHVMKVLSPYSERQAKQLGRVKDYTIEEAEQLITDDLTDTKNMAQAFRDFKGASKVELDFLGNPANPTDYYKKKWAPKIVEHNVGPTPMGRSNNSNGGGGGYPKMAGTLGVNINGVDELLFDNKSATEIPPLEFVEGGKDLVGRPYKIIYDTDAQGKPDPTMVIMVKEDKAKKIKGGERKLKWSQIRPTMRHKYGVDNIYNIPYGTYPENWTVTDERNGSAKAKPATEDKKVSATTTEETKTLPSYTREELAQKAKAAGYSYEDYYELVKDKVKIK